MNYNQKLFCLNMFNQRLFDLNISRLQFGLKNAEPEYRLFRFISFGICLDPWDRLSLLIGHLCALEAKIKCVRVGWWSKNNEVSDFCAQEQLSFILLKLSLVRDRLSLIPSDLLTYKFLGTMQKWIWQFAWNVCHFATFLVSICFRMVQFIKHTDKSN